MNRAYSGTPTGPGGFPAQSPVHVTPSTPTLPGPPPYGAPGTPTDSGYYGSLHNVAVPSPLSRGVSQQKDKEIYMTCLFTCTA